MTKRYVMVEVEGNESAESVAQKLSKSPAEVQSYDEAWKNRIHDLGGQCMGSTGVIANDIDWDVVDNADHEL